LSTGKRWREFFQGCYYADGGRETGKGSEKINLKECFTTAETTSTSLKSHKEKGGGNSASSGGREIVFKSHDGAFSRTAVIERRKKAKKTVSGYENLSLVKKTGTPPVEWGLVRNFWRRGGGGYAKLSRTVCSKGRCTCSFRRGRGLRRCQERRGSHA